MKRLLQLLRYLLDRLMVAGGALGLTLACFLVLPLMESIGHPAPADLVVQSIETVEAPPPPPPVEEEPEKEEEPEEEPPELSEEAQPLDLAQLEVALGPAVGGEGVLASIRIDATALVGENRQVEDIFSIADLDQKPRVIYQPSPVLDAKVRKKAPGTVYVLFIVDPRGRVESPTVQRSTDPVFEAPALAAVKQWKFEPGKRKGQPVRFRMRVPITFPEG